LNSVFVISSIIKVSVSRYEMAVLHHERTGASRCSDHCTSDLNISDQLFRINKEFGCILEITFIFRLVVLYLSWHLNDLLLCCSFSAPNYNSYFIVS
jgi:hypothetical protein